MADIAWQLCRTEAGLHDGPAALDSAVPQWMTVDQPGPIGALIAGTPLDTPTFAAIDGFDWWIRGEIRSDDKPSVLEFAGLSAPATVFLDDEPALIVTSTFLPASLTVPPGSHTVLIRCESLDQWVKKRRPRGRWRSTLTTAQGMRWVRASLLGRAPAYQGVPPVVGPWRPVTLHTSSWLDSIVVIPDPATGQVRVRGSLKTVTSEIPELTLAVTDPDGIFGSTIVVPVHSATTDVPAIERHEFDHTFTVDNPRPWWPRGYGPADLYRLRLKAGAAHTDRAFGFRTVTADRRNGGCQLSVNDTTIFCRGAVWTPPDLVAMTVDREVLRDQLTTLADANVNMVRIIGGFVFEQPELYDECAALGIMVWQDAMIATFDPPTELDDVVAQELATYLDLASGSPALAMVSGGNETIQQPEMLGLEPDTRAMPLLTERLPAVVADHAGVPYVTASPSATADGSPSELAIRPDRGVAHWFGVGGYLRPLDDVQLAGVRFAAESLAFAIPPSDEFVERHFGSLAVAGHHPSWKAGVPRDRTAAWDFEDVRDFYVRQIFGVDPMQVRRADPARYLQLGRLAVAEAMTACYSYWRRADSGCSGALVLNARDLVPGAGWGLLDVSGAPKLPLAPLSRVWAPTTLTIADAGQSGLRIDVHNDSAATIPGTLRIVAVDSRGNVVAEGSEDVALQPNSSITRYDSELTGVFADLSYAFRFGNPVAEAVEVTFEAADCMLREVHIIVPATSPTLANLTATVNESSSAAGVWDITVTARTSLRYVCLAIPGWKPADDAFHLAPGRPYTVPLTPTTNTSVTPPRGSVSSIDARDAALLQHEPGI